jgi:predicted CxxxxCH...CXXCH cytochrome family protein
LPPGGTHPPSPDCENCHSAVANGLTIIEPTLHINGLVDVNLDCNACHGSPGDPANPLLWAPPADVQGNVSTANSGVGAHQEHLAASNWRAAIACDDCHRVPAAVGEVGHIDSNLPAELTWGVLSRADGATPTFNAAGNTCTNVYCHGATLKPGGTNIAPAWTTVDGSQDACGTCHGLPPTGGHPPRTDCSRCHTAVIDANQNIIAPDLHIDGIVHAQTLCNGCHGSTGNSSDPLLQAPPSDSYGNTASSSPGVGAHQQHLASSNWHAPIGCDECHVVPADTQHVDGTSEAELSWGSTAGADGANPSYDSGTTTCSGVYCHGSTLQPGGSKITPDWTVTDGSQDACGTCHGLPPAGTHAARPDCETCHDTVWDGNNWVDPNLHINGTVEVSGGACDTCHGNPPTPSRESYVGAGGAHVTHVSTLALACDTCHGHNGSGPTHDQGSAVVSQANVDVVFDLAISFPGGTSMSNGGTPSTSNNGLSNLSCFVGCHNPIPGDTADLSNEVFWLDTSVSCADCHERPGTQPPTNHELDPTGAGDPAILAGCTTCHDVTGHTSGVLAFSDPDPGDTFSYASSGENGLCRTCHDGSGADFGGGAPANVGTFWSNPAAHEQASLDCSSCHEHHGTASGGLLIQREETACYQCHDGGAAGTDMQGQFARTSHHPVDDAEQNNWSVECVDCHDPHADTAGQPYVADPDPADGITPSGIDPSYCLTCHDAQQAPDKTAFLSSAHLAGTSGCVGDCHVTDAGNNGSAQAPNGPHGSSYPSLLTRFEEENCRACHTEVQEMSNAGTLTHHKVVDAEQGGLSSPLECSTCHDAHLVQTSPRRPIINPDTGQLFSAADVPHDSGQDPSAAAQDNELFCLTCHDGSWPDAKNVAAELSSNSVMNTPFNNGNRNLHRTHEDEPNGSNDVACTYCHNAHGNTGTASGAGLVVRGALLYNWLEVDEFPYRNKSSCSMGAGQPCH